MYCFLISIAHISYLSTYVYFIFYDINISFLYMIFQSLYIVANTD